MLWISVDDDVIYNNAWSWFNSLSQEVMEIAAFESDGTYVLHLRDIKFAESLIVKVKPTSEAVKNSLDEIFYKLEEV